MVFLLSDEFSDMNPCAHENHNQQTFLAQLASQPAELFIYSVQKLSVCGSVTLNAVTNRNHWTQRAEILHRGTYWWTVLGDQKLGHYFQGITENAYICIISASNWPAAVTKFA